MIVRTAGPSPVHRLIAVSLATVIALASALVAMPAQAAVTRTISGSFTIPASGVQSTWTQMTHISAESTTSDDYYTATIDFDAKTFAFTGLPAGAYNVQFGVSSGDITGDGIDDSSGLLPQQWADAFTIDVTGGDYTGLTYDYELGATVSGTVTLGAGASPSWVSEVEVSVNIPGAAGCECGDSIATRVSPDGTYILRGLPKKALGMTFGPASGSSANLIKEYWQNSYTWQGSSSLDFSTGNKTGIDATLEVGKTISGTVSLPGGVSTDSYRGIYAEAEGPNGEWAQAKVNTASGAYTIVGLAPLAYTLKFGANDWWNEDYTVFTATTLAPIFYGGTYSAASSTPVNVTGANATGKNITMPVGRTISGTVTLGSGIDTAWKQALYAYAETSGDTLSQYRSAKVDPTTGAYTIKGLVPGSYVVHFDGASLWDGTTYTYDDFAFEYWNNKRSPYAADVISVVSANATGKDAVMEWQSGNRDFWLTPIPTIVGSTEVGATLTASPDTWEPSASTFTYQWKRNGSNIGGATAATYVITEADAGASLTVAVTGSSAGYNPVTTTSAAFAGPATFTTAPTPTITGTPTVGQVVMAATGTWSPAPTFGYQWTRNGSPIASATSATYSLTPADLGATLAVTVTGTKAGYVTTARTASGVTVGEGAFASAPKPTISGTLIAGNQLTANVSAWSPAATFTYQWMHGVQEIPGATNATYTLTADDIQKGISVRVTGAATGYAAKSVESGSAWVDYGHFTNDTAPVISGTPTIGETLSVSTGSWTPAPTGYVYRWLRDNSYIPGAIASSYDLVAADGGAQITVEVTATKFGYQGGTKSSAAVTVPGQDFLLAGTPTFDTTFEVGDTMWASEALWDPSAQRYDYQWLRDGAPIAGATEANYIATAADLGKAISLRVTGHTTGYNATTVTTASTVVLAGHFGTTPTPTISGSTYLGATLTAKAGTWAPVVSGLTYQWYRNGAAISGAKAATYKLTSSDASKKITVKVTGSKSGYVSVAKTSSAVTIARYFTKIGTASVTGTVKVGYTVTASRGTWSPAPTSYSYQWYANGVAISGATKSTYAIGPSSAGKALSVKVTGKRSGYASQPKTSAAKTVAYATFKTAPTPKITGTVKVGYTLTAVRGTWSPAATSYSYQWYRSGSAISGATSYKYKLTSSDKAKTITVKVTAKKTGYATTAKVSAKTVSVK